MSDNEKNVPGDEETFEDIFSSLREKYNLEPSNYLVDLLYEALIYESNN